MSPIRISFLSEPAETVSAVRLERRKLALTRANSSRFEKGLVT